MAYRVALMAITGQAERFGSARAGMTSMRESCVAFGRAGEGPLDGRSYLACSEELIHDLGAGGDHRPQFPAVDDLGGPGGGTHRP